MSEQKTETGLKSLFSFPSQECKGPSSPSQRSEGPTGPFDTSAQLTLASEPRQTKLSRGIKQPVGCQRSEGEEFDTGGTPGGVQRRKRCSPTGRNLTSQTASNEIMPLSDIPDWKERLARQDTFWTRQSERPLIHLVVPKEKQEAAPPERHYNSLKERWLDPVRLAEIAAWRVRNTEYLADALPAVWPNLGPEVFSAYFGAELEYGETTAWAVPNLHDWAEADKLVFSEDNFYWKKTRELTDALLLAGQGLFYTGITDIHPGGDAVAAFRDPLNLNMDMLDNPDDLKRLLSRLEKSYFELFDRMYEYLRAAGQPCSSWIGIVSTKRFYIPSNDFSCMISPEMFNEFFLPGFIRECQHLDASIYHLDGPDAVRHLDALLNIKELNAVQWVRGAGRNLSQDCIEIYKRCQAAGKGIFLHASSMEELDFLIKNLRPEGIWLAGHFQNKLEAETVLRKIDKWV